MFIAIRAPEKLSNHNTDYSNVIQLILREASLDCIGNFKLAYTTVRDHPPPKKKTKQKANHKKKNKQNIEQIKTMKSFRGREGEF